MGVVLKLSTEREGLGSDRETRHRAGSVSDLYMGFLFFET